MKMLNTASHADACRVSSLACPHIKCTSTPTLVKPYTQPAKLRPVLPVHRQKWLTWKGAATVQDASVSDVLHYVDAAQQTEPPKIAVFSAHKYVRVVPHCTSFSTFLAISSM